MDNKIILTIGRQFGSGGREVGQKLAKELGIGYYDKELMALCREGKRTERGVFRESGREGFQWFWRMLLRWAIRIWGLFPAVCRCAV